MASTGKEDKITKLRVLLSSPNNLNKERTIFEDIISEANRYIEQVLDLTLIPWKWETHTYPDVGTDAQNVITTQMPEFDIYVGILGDKIGTQTPRFLSGTIEEFEYAFSKFQDDPTNKKILFYFKDVKKSIYDIDELEIEKIKAFKNILGSEGVYYWKYKSTYEFRSKLCFHLYRHAIQIQKNSKIGIKKESEEFILSFIEEGNKYTKLINDCFKLLYEDLMTSARDMNKLNRSFKTANKNRNTNLMTYSLKSFVEKIKSLNIKINFYFEVFSNFFNIVITNYSKGILLFAITGELTNILEGSISLKAALIELNSVIVKSRGQIDSVEFDRIFGTKIFSETSQLYRKFEDILNQSIDLTGEFIESCTNVN